MKLTRLIAILSLLTSKEKVTAVYLANKFEVSVRTIIRDMMTLSEAGIPIVSYQGYDGGYGLVEGYKLDKSVMTKSELGLALAALRGVNKAFSNQTVVELIEKFEHIDVNRTSQNLLIDLSSWGPSELENKKLSVLNEAIDQKVLITFSYVDSNAQVTERQIEPHLLLLKMSTWYLYGYCTDKKDFRLFRVGRMKDVSLIKETFESKSFNPNDILKLPSDPSKVKITELTLRFSPAGRNLVYDYFSSNVLSIEEDGHINVVAEFPEDEWLYSMLLGFGDKVEIIKPEAIRTCIKEKAQGILKYYE